MNDKTKLEIMQKTLDSLLHSLKAARGYRSINSVNRLLRDMEATILHAIVLTTDKPNVPQ